MLKATILGLFSVGLCEEMKPQTVQPTLSENQLKALFLLNFVRFVKWPPEAFAKADSPVIIGVLGDDPFGTLLDDLIQGESVDHRKLEVMRFQRVEDITTCHVLFISASEAGKLDRMFNVLAGKPILTVGDTKDFARRGGMIRFLTEHKKMRLHINLDSVHESRIEVSSKLLRLAVIVSGNKAIRGSNPRG